MAMSPRLLRPRATGFNPKSIAGLKLWLDANDTSTLTLNAGGVSEWRDKSGAGSPAAAQSTAANQPNYTTGGLNGKATVDFTSGTDQLVFGSSTASFNYLHNATGGTIFCVWKPSTSSDPNTIIYLFNNTNNSSSSTGIAVNFDDRASVSRNNVMLPSVFRGASGQSTASLVSASGFVTAADAFHVMSLVADNANATAASRLFLYHNGTASSATNTSTNAASTGNASFNLTIGNFGGGGAPASIAEILFYEGVLSSTSRQAVERYLGRKYGITVA